MLTDVPGIAVGHWTEAAARTGCTVVVAPEGTVGSGEVRGGAPGTREFALLAPERTVARVDAVVLAGGSAYGLAAADGVMGVLEGRGRGVAVPGGHVVPIVVAMVLFDLAVGDGTVRPDAAAGRAACAAAVSGRPVEVGRVGAGTGAMTGAWRGPAHARPSGLGTATRRAGPLVVSALVAVNAAGDVRDGAAAPVVADDEPPTWPDRPPDALGQTTIGVVATNARLDKLGCLLVAQGAHDGLARALDPAHSSVDGDAFVALSAGGAGPRVDAPVDRVRHLAALAVEAAIRTAAGGAPGQ